VSSRRGTLGHGAGQVVNERLHIDVGPVKELPQGSTPAEDGRTVVAMWKRLSLLARVAIAVLQVAVACGLLA